MALPIPPGPAVLGIVAPNAKVGVAGEALTVENSVHRPGTVTGVLPRSSVVILVEEGGVAMVLVQGPMPDPAGDNPLPPPIPFVAPHDAQQPVPAAAVAVGGGPSMVLVPYLKAILSVMLVFVGLLFFLYFVGWFLVDIGIFVAPPQPMCFPSEAPSPRPPPPQMQGDGGNYDHRTRAAGEHTRERWTGGNEEDMLICFKLIARQAVHTCFQQQQQQQGDTRRNSAQDRISCFKVLLREATQTCFGDD